MLVDRMGQLSVEMNNEKSLLLDHILVSSKLGENLLSLGKPADLGHNILLTKHNLSALDENTNLEILKGTCSIGFWRRSLNIGSLNKDFSKLQIGGNTKSLAIKGLAMEVDDISLDELDMYEEEVNSDFTKSQNSPKINDIRTDHSYANKGISVIPGLPDEEEIPVGDHTYASATTS